MMNITPTVKQLLIINIIFFIGSQLVGDATYKILALHYFENPDFKAWQPLTHMFMHGNLMHIFFNMFALFSFGTMLEQIWGGKKFLFFYLSCGLGAALLHTVVNYFQFHDALSTLAANGVDEAMVLQTLSEGKYDTTWQEMLPGNAFSNFIGSYVTPAVGASGAIYGLLAAFAFMFPNAELMMLFIPIPIKAKYFVPGLVLLDLYLGVSGRSIFGGGSGIAHFAHIGGALIGFIMMWYWKKNQFNQNRWN